MRHDPYHSDLLDLPNLGRTSVQWLVASGIRDSHSLRTRGAVEAWQDVRRRGFRATRSLLYALHGAITGQPWRELPAAVKADLWAQAHQP